MASNGRLIERMVPNAAPSGASAGTQSMWMSEASRCNSGPGVSRMPFFPEPQYFFLHLALTRDM